MSHAFSKPWCVTAVALLSACGAVIDEPLDASDEGQILVTSEGDALRSRLQPGDEAGTWTTQIYNLDTARRANRVGIKVDSTAALTAQLRVSEDQGKTFGRWAEISFTFDEEVAHNGFVEIPSTATQVQLRLKTDDVQVLDFLSFEAFAFADEIAGGGEVADESALGTAQQGLGASVAISRAGWGARPASCTSGMRPRKITIHHTATPNNDALSTAARIRQIQDYELNKGFCDIAYHFLVGRDGNVYQGRLETQLGAHAGGANTDNVGVAYIGNYDEVGVPSNMITGGARIVKAVADSWGIPIDRSHVFGHREQGIAQTACPGRFLFAQLANIVALARGTPGPGPTPTPLPDFSKMFFGLAATSSASGYYELKGDGAIYSFGAARYHGGANTSAQPALAVGLAARTDGSGYWIALQNGRVLAYGAPSYGDASKLQLTAGIVGIARTASGNGYWLVAKDGGIFGFGDAGFHGSMGGKHLNKPIVGMAATPGGKGYWLVASDGGIFAFGDAGFHGSTGSIALNKPIVGMAAHSTGKGYWLVASDGGIFGFGDVGFYGSLGGKTLNAPIAAMVSTPSGKGYWLMGYDGGIFSFGDAQYFGRAK